MRCVRLDSIITVVSSKDEVQAGFSKADAEQLALNNADFLGC